MEKKVDAATRDLEVVGSINVDEVHRRKQVLFNKFQINREGVKYFL